jgi:hypothetical protein
VSDAVFLTFLVTLLSVRAFMRRSLRIRTTHAPTRMSGEQLAFAYELLVSSKQHEVGVEAVAKHRDRVVRSTVAIGRPRRVST